MAFVDERSASGWLFPAARLLDEGIHPLDDITPQFYGNHDRVVEAVSTGEADAGATYAEMLRGGPGDLIADLHIVAKGDLVPHDAYVARPGLPEEVSTAMAAAMGEVSTRDEPGRLVLSQLRTVNGFIAVDDSHYDPVRVVDTQVREALEVSR